jgi:hypothetical protein
VVGVCTWAQDVCLVDTEGEGASKQGDKGIIIGGRKQSGGQTCSDDVASNA